MSKWIQVVPVHGNTVAAKITWKEKSLSSSGVWYSVIHWVFTNILKDHGAFIFSFKQSMSQHNIPEAYNLQQHCSENLKSCIGLELRQINAQKILAHADISLSK